MNNLKSNRFDPPPWAVALAAWACVSICVALLPFLSYDVYADPLMDFGVFYLEGRAWWNGEALYQHANLNTPLLTLVWFAPMALLPFRAAQLAWTVVWLIPLVTSVRIVARELSLTREQMAGMVLALFLFHGTYVNFSFGQTGWPLLWLVTAAWRRFRRDDHVWTGVWLGCAVAVKPTLALTALFLPWQVCLVAGMVSLGISLLGVAATGWEPWLAWYRTTQSVDWVNGFSNGSLWGLWARLHSGEVLGFGMHDFSAAAWVSVGIFAAALGYRTMTERDHDTRMGLAILAFLLLSPLAWAHYPILLLGPATVLWTRSAWLRAGLILGAVPVWPLVLRTLPPDIPFASSIVLLLGSLQTLAVLCACVAFARRPAVAGPRRHEAGTGPVIALGGGRPESDIQL